VHSGLSFAFLGGGPAALVLADRLVRHQRGTGRTFVIVDDTPPETDERTYAFWSSEPTPYDDSVFARWPSVALVGADGRTVDFDMGASSYRAFDMAHWRSALRDRLRARGVQWVEDTIDDVVADGSGLELHLRSGPPIRARWGFDSRYDSHSARPHTLQSFRGWWVRTDSDAFSRTATLMDFRLPSPDGVRFWYVLPASSRRALIMAVTFAPGPVPAPELAPYAELLGLAHWSVERTESGTLPMHPGPWDRRVGDRMLRIGLAGGCLKASTGYGLTRFVSDAAAVVASFDRHGHPFDTLPPPARSHWMDQVFLRAMAEHPTEAAEWFLALFEHVPSAPLLRFLDGRGMMADHARVARALPLGRFLPYLSS
jgi:lycopene beta-cyclase